MPYSEKKFQTPKGFFDIIGKDARIFEKIKDVLFKFAFLRGAEEILIAPVSFTETFLENNSLDLIKTYQFKDRSGRDLILNCDSLPSIMRAYIGKKTNFQSRYMFSVPVFRYRNARLRYYHHLGVTFINNNNLKDGELAILAILVDTLRSISSRKIHLTINDFSFWSLLFIHHGFSEKQAKEYCFLYRFKIRTKPSAEDSGSQLLEKIAANKELSNILDELHKKESRSFEKQWVDMKKIIPEKIVGELDPRYAKVTKFIKELGVSSFEFDINDFHSSEFFSGLSYQLYIGDDKKRIGDGGSYHEYGKLFSGGEITSVYSGVLRHEDLIEISDKLAIEKSTKILVSIVTRKTEAAKQIIQDIRANGTSVFDIYGVVKRSQLNIYSESKEFTHFITIGDRELSFGAVDVLDIGNGVTKKLSLYDLKNII